jgi:hypothetical protein
MSWLIDVDIVWENTVDQGKFSCQVVRTGDYKGQLQVKVTETDEVLLDEEVGLAYGAPFGPDIDDVNYWRGRSLQFIDKWLETH